MGEVIIVSSGKGGVGKTSVVTNLGVALSEKGKSVAVIDGSLTTPDISLHLGVPFYISGLSQILQGDSDLEVASYYHKSGLRIIPGDIHNNLLSEFEGKKFGKLLQKLKKQHDFVLVDCAAGLGREAVSAIQNCNKMLVVVNPELSSVVNASKTIQLAKNLKVEPTGVILNKVRIFGKQLKIDEIEPLMYGVPIIGKIPDNRKISKATKNSESVVNYYPRSRASKEFMKIASTLAGEESYY
jgi:septum site-determining protein MinD